MLVAQTDFCVHRIHPKFLSLLLVAKNSYRPVAKNIRKRYISRLFKGCAHRKTAINMHAYEESTLSSSFVGIKAGFSHDMQFYALMHML